MTNPGTFLSTLSESSAAMVAIIGGFLFSKLVTLSSEREGIKRQLTAARQNLSRLKKEYEPIHKYRLDNSKSTFFGFVIADLAEADEKDVDYEALVSDNVPRGSSVEEMLPYARELHARVIDAHKAVIDKLRDGDDETIDADDLKKRGLKIPEKDETIYSKVVDNLAKKLPPKPVSLLGGLRVPALRMSAITPAWAHEVDARRLDESIREETELKSQMDASGQEIKHLSSELAKIGKPAGAIPAVLILALLSGVGILLPVIVMAHNPVEISTKTVVILICLFGFGLSSVLGFVIWYINKLDAN